MKTVADEPKNRVVELDCRELRMKAYHERLLDEGWDPMTATKYVEIRFGKCEASFYRWLVW